MTKSFWKTLSTLLLVSILLNSCSFALPKAEEQKISEAEEQQTEEQQEVTAKAGHPDQAALQELITADAKQVSDTEAQAALQKIKNWKDFQWIFQQYPEAAGLLAKNGFVVVPAYSEEFYPLYESHRYAMIPNFITTDSLLHNYHLAFDFLLRRLETEKFYAILQDLLKGLDQAARTQFANLKGTEWENAAKRNLAYFSVARSLLGENFEVAPEIKGLVQQELALIQAKGGITPSPIMNLGAENAPAPEQNLEDYSQYIVRGHYTRSEILGKYFLSMMYLGRMNFRLKSEDETRSALLLTSLMNDPNLNGSWEKIYEPTKFLVGQSDDLGFHEYDQVLRTLYGDSSLSAYQDQGHLEDVIKKLKELAAPKINSMPIFDASFTPDREDAIQGFRLMGQRYTLDADVFQNLIYRSVDPAANGDQRMLPTVMDVAAAFGGELAYKLQSENPENLKYPNYLSNLDKMYAYIQKLTEDDWQQNIYWGWLGTIKSLLKVYGSEYPSFMRTLAWQYKSLWTFFGSFTELKHDTILYAKQVYAELGGGGDLEKKDDRGYVEPNTETYRRLATLVQLTKTGLTERALLDQAETDLLDRLFTLADTLAQISDKELNGTELSATDYEFIKAYGGDLEHIWAEANKDLEGVNAVSDEMSALVADVATDPNGEVLQEATGYIFTILVQIPGSDRLASGGVFSHYEFKQPLTDRLTDEAWRAKLREQQIPAPADWTKHFLVSKQAE